MKSALLAAAVGLLLIACGDDEAVGGSKPVPSVSLSLRVSDGSGPAQRAKLTCGRERRLTGYLRGKDGKSLCASAKRLGAFLSQQPDPQRQCIQIYGGPETARVRGRVGTRTVDRSFARTDGCEIRDWDRVKTLLAPGLR